MKLFEKYFKKEKLKQISNNSKRINSKSKLYLIKNLLIVKAIVKESQTPNGHFISQFKQPYLLIDSRFQRKIPHYEYDQLVNAFILR